MLAFSLNIFFYMRNLYFIRLRKAEEHHLGEA